MADLLTEKQEAFIAAYAAGPQWGASAVAAKWQPPAFDNPGGCYVYILVDSLNSEALYVGKGTGQRALLHERLARRGKHPNALLQKRIREVHSWNRTVDVRVFASDLTETEALQVERRLIGKWHKWLANISGGSRSTQERLKAWAEDYKAHILPFDVWCAAVNPSPWVKWCYWRILDELDLMIAGESYTEVGADKDGRVVLK